MPVRLWMGMGSRETSFYMDRQRKKTPHNILEAQTVLRLLEADAPAFARCRILLWCDTSVTVNTIRKGSSLSPIMRDIVRSILNSSHLHAASDSFVASAHSWKTQRDGGWIEPRHRLGTQRRVESQYNNYESMARNRRRSVRRGCLRRSKWPRSTSHAISLSH